MKIFCSERLNLSLVWPNHFFLSLSSIQSVTAKCLAMNMTIRVVLIFVLVSLTTSRHFDLNGETHAEFFTHG